MRAFDPNDVRVDPDGTAYTCYGKVDLQEFGRCLRFVVQARHAKTKRKHKTVVFHLLQSWNRAYGWFEAEEREEVGPPYVLGLPLLATLTLLTINVATALKEHEDKRPIPEVKATAVLGSDGWRLLVKCPYCDKEHSYDGGTADAPDVGADGGHKHPSCAELSFDERADGLIDSTPEATLFAMTSDPARGYIVTLANG